MTAPLALCDAASDLAYRVADLLSSPERVAATARQALAALPPELLQPAWQPASLLMGHPGIALLHIRCARNDARYAAVGHAHLAAAVAATAAAGPSVVGDLLLPAQLHADAHGGYTRLVARRQDHGPGLAADDYDVVSGLAGEGRGLLQAADRGDERCAEALREVLDFLVGMAHPVRSPTADGVQVPGWWCAPDRYLVPRDRDAYPNGDLNVGAAHGICGPLALLSLAHRSGHRVPGMTDALRRMADWVVSVGYSDGTGMRWHGRVAASEAAGAPSRPSARGAGARSRPGWCYGTSGIAWALYLAGRALGDHRLTSLAEEAIGGLLRRPLDAAVSTDPGFCHGRAGILHTVSRMAAATGRTDWWTAADALARELVAEYDAGTPFGYRQVVPPSPLSGPALHRVHNPGLLDGAAGIALVLADYADARRGVAVDEVSGWDAAVLMG
ncbi:lanthionine synthetase C family protein [Streptomyces tubercidicus]